MNPSRVKKNYTEKAEINPIHEDKSQRKKGTEILAKFK